MAVSRREFIAGGIGLISLCLYQSQLLQAAAQSAVIQPRKKGLGRVLVVVQLTGGNDGLNTVVPYTDPAYYNKRAALAYPAEQVLKLNGHLGLNPFMPGFHQLYKNGKMAVAQGVGYPRPSRSHFRSMEIWHTARPDSSEQTGWLGRYIYLLEDDCKDSGHFMPAVNVDSHFSGPVKSSCLGTPSVEGVFASGPEAHLGPLDSSEFLNTWKGRYKGEIRYPRGNFARRLKLIAQMIAGGINSRVYTVSLDGFDTHSRQRVPHGRLLKTLSEGILAFQSDLELHNCDEDVLTFVFSEFGRRLPVNQEGGTDHGSAQPLFLIGSRVNAGIYGDHPSLLDLDSGEIKYRIDFRTIYATILDRWMNADSSLILGDRFDYMTFV